MGRIAVDDGDDVMMMMKMMMMTGIRKLSKRAASQWWCPIR